MVCNPVFADRARVVLAPPPHHRPNGLIDEEDAADRDCPESHPQHAQILGHCEALCKLTFVPRRKCRGTPKHKIVIRRERAIGREVV
jgi:hypothetical protein